MTPKIISSLLFIFSFTIISFSQLPLSNATLDITMQCTGGTTTRTGISYNPIAQLYYSVNAGGSSSTFPIETFDITGTPVASATPGFDYRGSWWNPNTNQLEGNGYNNLGIWIQDLDANSYAINTGTSSISLVSGPNIQSSANYDSNDDEILYYDNGTIYRHARIDHSLIGSVSITGLPVAFSDINTNTIAYTGVSGMEAGIYDFTNKIFYFINKTTGAYVNSCQLPLTAPAVSSFRMGFANGRLWLYDDTALQWKGYLTVPQCSSSTNTITVESCETYTVPSGDETYATLGSQVVMDTIPNISGCDSILTINLTINTATSGIDNITACDSIIWIDGITYTSNNTTAIHTLIGQASTGCDSIVTLNLTINTVDVTVITNDPTITANVFGANYQWLNCDNNYSIVTGETNQAFTALSNGNWAVQIEQNGCTDTSSCTLISTVGIHDNAKPNNKVSIFPNPSKGIFTIKTHDIINTQIIIYNLNGEKVSFSKNISDAGMTINLNQPKGIYFIEVKSNNSIETYKLIKQ